jgi:hypothetical protein
MVNIRSVVCNVYHTSRSVIVWIKFRDVWYIQMYLRRYPVNLHVTRCAHIEAEHAVGLSRLWKHERHVEVKKLFRMATPETMML